MANINYYKPAKIDELIGDLEQYKYQPSALKTVTLNRLSDMLSGAIDVVDPSNPFTYLLETSIVNASFSIQEYAKLDKKRYKRMANSEADLYPHMSDYDFLGRFGEPAQANVWFNILLSDFEKRAISTYDSNSNFVKKTLTIPRMYTLTIASYTFTLLYPIHIVRYENGVTEISYDVSVPTVLQTLNTVFVQFSTVKQYNGESWLRFSVPMLELAVSGNEIAVEKSKVFKETIAYPEGSIYYYAEVYHMVAGVWTRMLTTHTQEIYDINTPTACLTVLQDTNQLIVYIPPVYVINSLVSSKVRVDVYTTSGKIDVNFSDFRTDDFAPQYTQVDKVRDLVPTAAPLNLVGKLVYIAEQVTGGKGRMSFNELKAAVINNSIGDRLLPITQNQLDFELEQSGFKLIKEIDVITNRIVFLQKDVPVPQQAYPISKLDMDMSEYLGTLADMVATGSVVNTGMGRFIIPENTVFLSENSVLTLLTLTEKTALAALVQTPLLNEVNSKNYLSTFYHYVIDTNNNKTALRAYDLDAAGITNINFDSANPTSLYGINTTGLHFYKTDRGYTFTATAAITSYSSTISHNVRPYLIYTDAKGRNFYATTSAISIAQVGDNGAYLDSTYSIYVDTKSFDIDASDNVYLTSFVNENNQVTSIAVPLESTLKLIYVIVADEPVTGYVQSANDKYVTNNAVFSGVTLVPTGETLTIKYGSKLKYLNTMIRNVSDAPQYKTYAVDVPLTYDHDVYGDPTLDVGIVCVDDSCNITTPVPTGYKKGDYVYDSNGDLVYKYRAGDVVLDGDGYPIPVANTSIARHMTLMFVDYRSRLCTAQSYVDYLAYVRANLTSNILNNMASIQSRLLENTEGYFVIPNTLNQVRVNINNGVDTYVSPSVTFSVNVYAPSKIVDDYAARQNIKTKIIKDIDAYLSKSVLIKTELSNILYTSLKQYVTSVSVANFVTSDAEYIAVKDTTNKLTLAKLLIVDSDGTYNLTEAITVTFSKTK